MSDEINKIENEVKQVVTTFWQRHEKWIVVTGIALLVFVGGYATGRYAAPAKTIVQEKVVTVEKQVVVEKVKTEVKVVRVEDTKTRRHIDDHQIKHPDGTEERKTITDENIDSVVHDQEIRYVDREVVKEVEKKVEVEKLKLVEYNRPAWRVGPLIGVNLPSNNPGFDIALGGRLVVGAEVEHRLVGPLSVGVWGLSSGQAGVKVGMEF